MSSGSSSTKKAIIGGVLGGALLGGAYLVFSGALSGKKKQEEEEDAFGTDTHKSQAAAPVQDDEPAIVTTSSPSTQPKPKAAEVGQTSTGPSPTSSGAGFPQVNSNYEFEETKKNAGKNDAPIAPSTVAQKEFPAEEVDGQKHFPRLGVVMKLPQIGGWDAKQEVSPVPTASMITIMKPEFMNAPPPMSPMDFGKVPIILLSVEDISLEGLTPEEYAMKKKMIGMQQLMAMTQMAGQPRLFHEGPATSGPFTFCLEYGVNAGPIAISVMDLFCVMNGFAFCLQIMAKPDVVKQYKPEMNEIANGIQLFPQPLAETFTDISCLRVRTGALETVAPPSWNVQQRVQSSENPMVVFHTASQQKLDAITVCKSSSEAVLDLLASGTVQKETKNLGDDRDITLTVIKEGRDEKKLATRGEFAVIAKPVKTSAVTISEGFLVEIAQYTSACSEPAGIFYESQARGFRFEIAQQKAQVLETRVGDGAIFFSPGGLESMGPQGQNSGAPALTIRIEDPATDPDCMPDLDTWQQRIQAEATQDPGMVDIKREMVCGRDSLTFMNNEKVQTGPASFEERCAKIVMFTNREGRTHMLRWEASGGNFKQTENDFKALLNSYALF